MRNIIWGDAQLYRDTEGLIVIYQLCSIRTGLHNTTDRVFLTDGQQNYKLVECDSPAIV